MSLGATLVGSLLAVLDRPSTWPLALAGFLIRGGWLLVVAPIVVLPTAVGLANVIAPLLEDIAFGRRLGELVVLIVVALVVVVGWLIGGGLFAALAELEVVRRIAPDSGEGQASPVEAADPWTAAWRIVAVRLAAHVPFAIVLVWGATRIASVGYAELTVPSDVTVPAPWRIATGAPDAIVGIVLTWLLGEAIGAMGARRVALRGEAARPALRAAIATVRAVAGQAVAPCAPPDDRPRGCHRADRDRGRDRFGRRSVRIRPGRCVGRHDRAPGGLRGPVRGRDHAARAHLGLARSDLDIRCGRSGERDVRGRR